MNCQTSRRDENRWINWVGSILLVTVFLLFAIIMGEVLVEGLSCSVVSGSLTLAIV